MMTPVFTILVISTLTIVVDCCRFISSGWRCSRSSYYSLHINFYMMYQPSARGFFFVCPGDSIYIETVDLWCGCPVEVIHMSREELTLSSTSSYIRALSSGIIQSEVYINVNNYYFILNNQFKLVCRWRVHNALCYTWLVRSLSWLCLSFVFFLWFLLDRSSGISAHGSSAAVRH